MLFLSLLRWSYYLSSLLFTWSIALIDFLMLKTRHQAPNAVGHAKPYVTKPRLNYSFWLSQKRNLKPVSQGSPDQHWLGHRPDRPLPSPKEKGPCNNQLAFWLVWLPCSCSLLPTKVSHFVQLLGAPFHLLMGCCLIHELLNKANNIFKIYSVEFWFWTLIFKQTDLR